MNRFLDALVPGRADPSLDFRTRGQIPYLALTATTLFLGFLCLLPLTLLHNGADAFFALLSAVSALLLVAVVMLRAGRYRGASYCVTIVLISASFAALYLMSYDGKSVLESYRGLAFAAVMMTVNTVAALGKGQLWLFYLAFAPGWALSFFVTFRAYLEAERGSAVITLAVGFLGLTCETVMLFLIRSLSERMLETAEKQTRVADESLARVTGLLEDAKEGLSLGGRIMEEADTSQRAAANVAEIQDYLSTESGRLVGETASLAESSRKVMESAQGLRDGLDSQNAAITETSAALVEISQNVRSIADVASQRRGMLGEASSAAEAQRALLRRLDEAIRSVQDSSAGVSEFVSMVQDVASRTALLSMNASIEAARAGSAGKGFGVVAQEIRSLSGEAQKNADRIKEIIERNDETVRGAGALFDEFSRFVGKSVEDTGALIESMDEILGGINEMSLGTGEVMRAVEQMVAGTQASGEMVRDVVAQVDTQRAGLSHLSAFTTGLNERIAGLEKAVSEIRAATDRVSEAGRLNVAHSSKLRE